MVRKPLVPATIAKKIHTAIEPTTAPVSGRTRSRRSGLTRSIRSPVITLIFPSIGNVGASLVAARLETGDHMVHRLLAARLETGDHMDCPYMTSLAGSRRRQLDYLAHVRRVDEAGAGLDDTVRDSLEIRLVQRQQNDGQRSPAVLLLVNGH